MTTFFDTFDHTSENYYVTPLLAPRNPIIPPGARATNDTKYYEKFYFTVTYSNVSLLVSFIIFICWVIGINTLIILGIHQTQRRLMSDLYMASLSVADIILCFCVFNMGIVVVLRYFPFGDFVCSLYIYVDYFLIITTSCLWAALLWNYAWMIFYPDHYKTKDFKTHVTIIVIIILVVHVMWGPPFFYDRVQNDTDGMGVCGYSISENQNKYFALYMGICGLYLPAIFSVALAIFCGRAVFTARRRVFFGDIIPHEHRQLPNDGVKVFFVKVLPLEEKPMETDYMEIASTHLPPTLCIFSVFLATRLAFYIYFGAGAFIPKLLPPDLSDGVYWVMHSQSAIIPFLHILLDSELRLGIKQLLRLNRRFPPSQVAAAALLLH